jgi:hypothetical protein
MFIIYRIFLKNIYITLNATLAKCYRHKACTRAGKNNALLKLLLLMAASHGCARQLGVGDGLEPVVLLCLECRVAAQRYQY